MNTRTSNLPKWILIISALVAILEILVSISLCVSPEEVLDQVDLSAKGVMYVVYMWAARQFALGFIFAFATFKRSLPMLILAYIFFLIMFIGDFLIGILQKENSLIIAAVLMILASAAMIVVLNKRSKNKPEAIV